MRDFDPLLREYLRKIVSDEGLCVVESFPDGQEMADEKIAELSGVNLYSVRKTLYILHEKRMAKYRRIRNEDNGWMTYLWKLDFSDFHDLLKEEVRRLLSNLKRRLEYERSNVFYICRVNGCRVTFDEAARLNFRCPECGGQLEHLDNSPHIRAIEEKIRELSPLLL